MRDARGQTLRAFQQRNGRGGNLPGRKGGKSRKWREGSADRRDRTKQPAGWRAGPADQAVPERGQAGSEVRRRLRGRPPAVDEWGGCRPAAGGAGRPAGSGLGGRQGRQAEHEDGQGQGVEPGQVCRPAAAQVDRFISAFSSAA